MYAVIETGGKQYRVEVGTELAVELLEVEAGQEIMLERVLLVADGDEAAIGRPVVDGATVSATVLRNDRADKVISFKYKPKARRRVKKGHRQEQTVLRITDVTLNGKSAADEARKAAEARKTERQRLEEVAATQAAADAALAATLAAKVARAEEAVEAGPADADAPKKTQRRAAKADAPKAEASNEEAPDTLAAAPPTKPRRSRAAKKED
ncbi:MAG TPA: 50S ribosomal protein L21 [Patescibacteria group bacterium]|nr:50S ribosomal protein L21 [Patescibacteria group bacterium]